MRLPTLSATAGGALLACLAFGSVEAQTPAELTALELYWSYGMSPPVYPSPNATGLGDWTAAFRNATALVAQMTNEEKQNITIGYYGAPNGCSGNSGGVPRLGYPGMCLNDAGNGLRGTDGTNGYASALHVGAAWNRNLAHQRGVYMGAEFKAKGVNVALGPVVGPLGRVALGGRNWEGFSNDPYLTGDLAAQTVHGMQKSVITTIKHFIAYEQETNRSPEGNNVSVSSNLDDKTMHELYLWPFQDAIRAGSGAAMSSYNRINNSYASQNSKALNGLLKTELGFQGFVVSDWSGQHTGIASANAGLDMAMPNSPDYWSPDNLVQGVSNGTFTQSRLDDMAIRIVTAWYKFAPFPSPGFGVPANLEQPHQIVDARDPAAKGTIFQGAVEGHVLVKNTNNALPLKSPKQLSLFGFDGYAPLQNNWPASGYGRWTIGFESVNTNDSQVLAIFTDPQNPITPESAVNGTIISGGGSGATTPAYINSPYDAFQQQAYQDGTWLAWDFQSVDPVVEGGSNACIVFVNEFASEGFDRPGLADPYSDTLIMNVAAKCNNTIVVIHNAGIRLVDAWVDNPNITAVVYAHLPGQDSGRSLIEVMYGQQSFSGRLPYTVAHQASDYGSLLAPTRPDSTSDYYTQSNFTEGVYIDYKAFIANGISPRYPFGYGLTYTTFAYSGLSTNLSTTNSFSSMPPTMKMAIGGNPHLWDVLATVSCTITNTGSFTAKEVAQLYVGVPGGPAKVLRGYEKVKIMPGNATSVSFALTRRDLSTWDTISQEWLLQEGTYPVYVGASVEDIRLTGSLDIS